MHKPHGPQKSIILTLLLVFVLGVCMFSMPQPGLGDAGGFSGSSDYGGSFDSGSSDWGSSGGSSYYSSDGSSGGDFEDFIIAIVIVGCIIAFVAVKSAVSKGKGGSGAGQPAGAQITDGSMLRSFDELVAIDPQFDKAKVEERLSNTYVKIQNAWTAGDMEPVRPYFEDALFSQFARQLDALKSQGLVNYVGNIAVLECTARGWYESEGKEYLVLKVRTRINDYTVDSTGAVVQGSKDRELFMEYEYALSRPAGTKTETQQGDIAVNVCPNCGAPLNEGASAKCPYCDSVITVKYHDWVISSIKGVSQQTA